MYASGRSFNQSGSRPHQWQSDNIPTALISELPVTPDETLIMEVNSSINILYAGAFHKLLVVWYISRKICL